MDDDRERFDLLRRRVVNVVGHELRTPATTLRGLAEMLGSTRSVEEARALHEALRRTARRLEGLVDDLLVSSGIATALPVDEPEPTDVAAAASEAWSSLEDVPGGVDVNLDIAPGLAVLSRPGALRRSLHAVLDNAVRYGAPPVGIGAERDGDLVTISVTDAGPGIPQAERPLVSEAFFRGERAVTTSPGLGLGLALANDLLRHDGGDLAVAPAEHGTVVLIHLPAAGR